MRELNLNLNRWVIRLAKILIILIPLGIALVFVGIQVSSLPGFCGFCHIMKPYYEFWRTSSHNEVICAECHIAPGIVSELQKKFETAAIVVSYFTGTYGTNPWAEIPDESCLRPGCHEKRLLLGREVYKGILFDHRPHLEELRREKKTKMHQLSFADRSRPAYYRHLRHLLPVPFQGDKARRRHSQLRPMP